MTDVDGQVLTLESVRAAFAADLERDVQAVVEVSQLERDFRATIDKATQLYAALADKYAAAAAKPYLKDKLTELGIHDPSATQVTIGAAKKSPAKRTAAKKAASKKTVNSSVSAGLTSEDSPAARAGADGAGGGNTP